MPSIRTAARNLLRWTKKRQMSPRISFEITKEMPDVYVVLANTRISDASSIAVKMLTFSAVSASKSSG